MKKIMTTLCAAFFAFAISAQNSKDLRIHNNPKVERLIEYCKSQGSMFVLNGGETKYQNDGKHSKRARLLFMREFPTGEKSTDHISQAVDSVRRVRNSIYDNIEDSIRKTFIDLSKEVSESYMWEYHNDGIDTIQYTVVFGRYANDNRSRTELHKHQPQPYQVPELLSYQYFKSKKSSIGSGSLFYHFSPDSTYSPTQYIDQEKYEKILQGIFNQDGFSKRAIYVYNDNDHPYDDSEVMIGMHWNTPVQPYIETKVTVYTTKSEELALSTLHSLTEATFQFIDENPRLDFELTPRSAFNRNSFSPALLFRSKRLSRIYKEYQVRLQYLQNNKEYCFLILDINGNMMLPKEWIKLKSWKNGKKTYDKNRKSILPERSSDNLVGVGDYQVLDEKE